MSENVCVCERERARKSERERERDSESERRREKERDKEREKERERPDSIVLAETHKATHDLILALVVRRTVPNVFLVQLVCLTEF